MKNIVLYILTNKYLLLLLTFSSTSVLADLPLTVEDLITDKNKFKLNTNINYFNHSQRSLNEQGHSIVDLGNGRTLTLSNPPSEGITNTDSLIGTMGLNYGVTDKWEVGIKANTIYNQTRQNVQEANSKKTNKDFQDIAFTTQYQTTSNHDKLPDSLIFSEISLYNQSDRLSSKALSSILVGGTIYTINDPIVLSLTSSYNYNRKRNFIDQNQSSIKSGNTLSISSLVGFAVNPDITLNAGLSWQLIEPDKVNQKEVSSYQTQTNLNLGLAYALSERNNLAANVRSDISGKGGSSISLGLTTKLGKLPEPFSQRYKKLRNQSTDIN